MNARRAVALVSFAAAVLSLLSSALLDVARYRDGSFAATAAELVNIGKDRAGVFWWSNITDMLGSYLLMTPLMVWLWRMLRDDGGYMVDIATAAALMYIAAGGAAAAAWAAAGEPLIRQHAMASGADASATAVTFAAVANSVTAVWHLCGGVAGGVWWIGIGRALRRVLPRFSVFSVTMGVVALLSAVGSMFVPEGHSNLPASLLFWPIAVWAAWLGIHLWRGQVLGDDRITSTHAGRSPARR